MGTVSTCAPHTTPGGAFHTGYADSAPGVMQRALFFILHHLKSPMRWSCQSVGCGSEFLSGPGLGDSAGEPRGQWRPGSHLSRKEGVTVGRRGDAGISTRNSPALSLYLGQTTPLPFMSGHLKGSPGSVSSWRHVQTVPCRSYRGGHDCQSQDLWASEAVAGSAQREEPRAVYWGG